MISIIVCSIKPGQCRQMLDTVQATIDIAFETIVFDNREKNWGLCKVYNYCAEQAKYPYLCFVHEDISIKTAGWGQRMIDFAGQTPDCGAIGIAGGRQVTRNFKGWANGRYHYFERDRKTKEFVFYEKNPEKEQFSRVLTLDGVFLFVQKKIWKEVPFDEKNFPAFHLYDADFTFSVAQHYKNYACLTEDIYHFSGGNVNRTYCDGLYAFQKKWKKRLPQYLDRKNLLQRIKSEYGNAWVVYQLYKKHAIPFKQRISRLREINSAWFVIGFVLYAGIKRSTD